MSLVSPTPKKMPRRILVLDTTVLCCWLKVPGKDTCGPEADKWNFDRIDELLGQEEAQGSTFVLPLATLIETGNHISQCNGDRFQLAQTLTTCLSSAANATSPWAAFGDQSDLWNAEGLKTLSEQWPNLAAARMSIDDATIKAVAEYYAVAGFQVRILTGDQGLEAYQSPRSIEVPRRRRKLT